MNLLALATDNISELLVKIIEFTQTRQKILTQNINNIHSPGFVPKDMAVEEFSALLNDAIDEYIQNQRLVLCDAENIKFGLNGSFRAKPIMDDYAKELLEEDPDGYLELQINKLTENSLNQRVAAELLRQRQETILTPLYRG
jgi:flagellar basal body rod protein FlgB